MMGSTVSTAVFQCNNFSSSWAFCCMLTCLPCNENSLLHFLVIFIPEATSG